MLDIRRWHIHKTRSVRAHIQAGDIAQHFPALMLDRESIPQDCNLAGETRKRRHRENSDECLSKPNL